MPRNLNKIVIKGRIPSKKNSRCLFVRGGKLFNIPSKKYAEWHKEALNQLPEQEIEKSISKIELIALRFYAPDKRKTDLTNKAESILDLLVDAGILEDDNWFQIGKVFLYFEGVDRKNPRCEIEIRREE